MFLDSPRDLHYPVTITELLVRSSQHVDRDTRLFEYSYKSVVTREDEFGGEVQVEQTYPAHYKSNVEGVLRKWSVERGTVIAGPK